MEWLRTFDEKDIRYCFIEGEGQLKSVRVSINKFNRYEGYDRGICLTSQFIGEVGLLRVVALIDASTATLKIEQLFKYYWTVVSGLAAISLILAWFGL